VELATRRRLTLGTGRGRHERRRHDLHDRRPDIDPDRADQNVRVGTVEDWTIATVSTMDHPFQRHVWPMQLVAEAS
jgi:hypothetical protein